jgi:hypothetical protein
MANASVDKAVKKSVKGEDWIDDDEYNASSVELRRSSPIQALLGNLRNILVCTNANPTTPLPSRKPPLTPKL